MALELRQLRYFVTAAEEGQLTRAAEKLHLAQPALSQAIGRLEAQLGLKLLERRARGVEVTPAGRAFLEKARATLEAADDVDATARSWARAQLGQLRMGFMSLTPPMMAGALFDRFAAARPEVTIEWRELGYPAVDARLWLRDVDAALIWFAPSGHGIAKQVIRTSPLVAAVSDRHHLAGRTRLTVADVLDETFPGVASSCDPGWLANWGLDRYRGAPARRTADAGNTPNEVASIVSSGRAITTVPIEVAAGFTHLGLQAIPLVDAAPALLTIVWPDDVSNPLVDQLAVIARQAFENDGHRP
jgi:DNA-binding transcriptional LysR family regulator